MSRFEELVSIIGVKLAARVCAQMGGKHMRIRKKVVTHLSVYLADQMYYDSLSIAKAAKRVGCAPTTMKIWRYGKPKTYVP